MNKIRINFNCENCGKICKIGENRFKKTRNHFCSKNCYYSWRKGKSLEEIYKNGQEAKIKMSETRKRLFNEGKIKNWQEGLTKETDKRLKEWSLNMSGKNNPNYGKKMSEEEKRIKSIIAKTNPKIKATQFKKGQVSPFKGKNHTEEWKKEFSKNRRNLFKEGKLKIWAEGLKGDEYLKHFKEGKIWNTDLTSEKDYRIHSREKNGNWKGGTSFIFYNKFFNNRFKRKIRQRDNYICMNCGIHQEKLDKSLDIHHINYDKTLSIPQNCISLCKECHIIVNNNRKQWITFFQSLLFERYGYNYDNEIKVYEINYEQKKLI